MNEPIDPAVIWEVRRKAPRNVERDTVVGYVVAQSEALLLIQHVTERFDLDGYFLIPKRDVLAMQPEQRSVFTAEVLALKGLTPEDPGVPIETEATACAWLRRTGTACLIEVRDEADICYVGFVRSVSRVGFDFLHLSTRAVREETETFTFAEVDCIGFGGDYERGLMLHDIERHGPPPS